MQRISLLLTMTGRISTLVPVLAAILFSICWATELPANDTEYSAGFGYGLLLAKMDYLEYKFLELQTEAKEQTESLLERTGDILEQQKVFSNHEKIMKSIYELNPRKHPADNSQLLKYRTDAVYRKQQTPMPISIVSNVSNVSSCRTETSKKSGRYWMKLDGSDPFQVYCEQTFYGGGWIVIQNRFNGSVHFNRSWTEYKNGFGSLDGEFWLGLENIHKITTATINELLIHLEDFDGLAKYTRFKRFTVGAESEQYKLTAVEFQNAGFLGDSLSSHAGKKFSTPDVDNDNNGANCAGYFSSGWWFDSCFSSNLNGIHADVDGQGSISWYSFAGRHKGLRISKMMVRQAKW